MTSLNKRIQLRSVLCTAIVIYISKGFIIILGIINTLNQSNGNGATYS